MNSNSIRPMCAADLGFVEKIHFEGFPHSRSTRLGPLFVRKMYSWFLENEPTLAFVAIRGGQPVGFITGSLGSYGQKVFRYALFEILIGFMRRPKLLLNRKMFLSGYSFLRGLLPKSEISPQSSGFDLDTRKVSLASIAVANTERGKHIGETLISAFEDAARKRGAMCLELSVKIDNIAARRLYENCAWQLANENSDKNIATYIKKII